MLYIFRIICYKSMKTFPDYKTNHKDLNEGNPINKSWPLLRPVAYTV